MSRIHLIEFHEQSWVPAILREGVTDYLRAVTKIAGHYGAILPLLQTTLEESGAQQILDLGSGAGGGWPELQPQITTAQGDPVKVWLSDLQPNFPAWKALKNDGNGYIDFVEAPTDARKPGHGGLRTMFNLFHHFRPSDAKAILKDASDQRQPILIIEALDDSPIQAFLILILAPIMVLLITPVIRPFRWTRLLFTYLIPVIPLMVAWDGFVSILRLYSLK
ncbi:MAG: class I SAM-dependent methyltransferase, partial [Bacteroidia bacterium]|nr:class I SAM-dependent methyltransferase [Bacteroidia bacterium]